MKKLEDIPKKNIYTTPDGYFDHLPGIIQSRIAVEKREVERPVYFKLALRYALPVIALATVLFFVLRNDPLKGSPDELLASVSAQELTSYLMESGFTTEELMENIAWSELDVDLDDAEIAYPEFDTDALEEFSDELPLEL